VSRRPIEVVSSFPRLERDLLDRDAQPRVVEMNEWLFTSRPRSRLRYETAFIL